MMRTKPESNFRARVRQKIEKLSSDKSAKANAREPTRQKNMITEKVDRIWISHMEEYLFQIRGWGGTELKELEGRRIAEGKPSLNQLLDNTRKEKDMQKRGEMAMEAWKAIASICVIKTEVIDPKLKTNFLNQIENAYTFDDAKIVARKELVYHINFYKYQFVKAFDLDPEVTEHMQSLESLKRKLNMGEYTDPYEKSELEKAIEEEKREIDRGILNIYRHSSTSNPNFNKALEKRKRGGVDPTLPKFFSYFNDMMALDKAGNYLGNEGIWAYWYTIAYQTYRDNALHDELPKEERMPPPLVSPIVATQT